MVARRPLLLTMISFVMSLLSTLLSACTTSHVNRSCVGETFPTVGGEGLDQKAWKLPSDLAGKPAVILIGYLQEAQFDADRWLFGLLQSQTPARLLELPTLPGLFPRAAASMIDGGMRSGIPSEDWQSVVTLYGADAAAITEFTGNEHGRNIRVLLLDQDGKVAWFHDRGFSAGKLLELDTTARGLATRGAIESGR